MKLIFAEQWHFVKSRASRWWHACANEERSLIQSSFNTARNLLYRNANQVNHELFYERERERERESEKYCTVTYQHRANRRSRRTFVSESFNNGIKWTMFHRKKNSSTNVIRRIRYYWKDLIKTCRGEIYRTGGQSSLFKLLTCCVENWLEFPKVTLFTEWLLFSQK